LFEHFDRLLLLQKGGQTVYFGKIGKDSQHLNAYLEKNGAPVPSSANTAEYMLEAIGAGSTERIGSKDWAEVWRKSEEFQQVKQEIESFKEEAKTKANETLSEGSDIKHLEYTQPWQEQLRLVIKRQNLAFWRRPEYGFTR
jgi:ATP-binding cassette subfamily G (WHITE) protein 2 (SNQ2)